MREPGRDQKWLGLALCVFSRKPDAAVGSSSVQNMFNNPPQNEAEASAQLLHDSRMQAFRWSSEQVRHEFTPTTWAVFWQSTVEERSIDEVAKNHDRSKGAAYLARYRVMKRLLMFVILLSVRVNPAAESGRTGALADPSMRFLIVCSLASTD